MVGVPFSRHRWVWDGLQRTQSGLRWQGESEIGRAKGKESDGRREVAEKWDGPNC